MQPATQHPSQKGAPPPPPSQNKGWSSVDKLYRAPHEFDVAGTFEPKSKKQENKVNYTLLIKLVGYTKQLIKQLPQLPYLLLRSVKKVFMVAINLAHLVKCFLLRQGLN